MNPIVINGTVLCDNITGIPRYVYETVVRLAADVAPYFENMRKFWSNGASSQRKRVRQSLCWICLCLTRGGIATSPER